MFQARWFLKVRGVQKSIYYCSLIRIGYWGQSLTISLDYICFSFVCVSVCVLFLFVRKRTSIVFHYVI
jgi:hypothetical protein